MKICLLTRRFALDSGGIGRVSIELKNALKELGHEVYTVSTTREDLANYFMYTFYSIRSKIPKSMDIYHAITPMESIWIPKDRGIVTILDIIPILHSKKQGARIGKNRIKRFIGKACFAYGCRKAIQCRKIVCISEYVKQEFIEHTHIPEERVKVIRLGIREDLRPYGERSRKEFKIGYLGQLDRRKRIDMLINQFRASRLDAELVIAGQGIDKPLLENLANGDSRIKFLGFVPDDKLAAFYNSLDIMVFPTAIEGYGLPPVEAMACRVPTLVLDDAIIPWEVKSRCIIVENLNTAFSSQAYLESLLQHIDYDNNYKFAREHNWSKCVGEYIKLYKEISAC